METFILKDGTSKSHVLENCKIFDENTFECGSSTHSYADKTIVLGGSSSHHILSNGIYEYTSWFGITIINGEKSKEINSYKCATEIKSIFNLFK
jgi:hypothetical protein